MSDIERARKALLQRILEGNGKAAHVQRRAAFDSEPGGNLGYLFDKVSRHAYRVTDEDIANAGKLGLTEDQIFEVLVCAAVGEANRQYEVAIAALEAALTKD